MFIVARAEFAKLAFSCLFCVRKVAVLHTACEKVADAQINLLSRTPCVKQLLCVCKTNKKASFTHSVKKNRFRYTCAKSVIIAWGFLSPELRSGDKQHPCGNHPLRTLVSKITILLLKVPVYDTI